MTDGKKYEISTAELKKYICLAMNEVMPKGVTPEEEEKFVEFAADIEIRIEAHLNGEKPFKSRDAKDYELVSIVMDSLNGLCNLISKREGEQMYYNECPFCGANLDPGELCDCQDSRK